jgi:hypothetical protein
VTTPVRKNVNVIEQNSTTGNSKASKDHNPEEDAQRSMSLLLSTFAAWLMYKLAEETCSWPVPVEHHLKFDSITCSNHIHLLPVFFKDKFVEPIQAYAHLVNALVEVHFSLKHYSLDNKSGGGKFDCFMATVEDVIISK